MRTSTSGCSAVKPRRRGISHSEAKPLVVVTVSWGAAPSARSRSVVSCSRSSNSAAARCSDAALLGQHQSAMPALEQRHAQMLLQRRGSAG